MYQCCSDKPTTVRPTRMNCSSFVTENVKPEDQLLHQRGGVSSDYHSQKSQISILRDHSFKTELGNYLYRPYERSAFESLLSRF